MRTSSACGMPAVAQGLGAGALGDSADSWRGRRRRRHRCPRSRRARHNGGDPPAEWRQDVVHPSSRNRSSWPGAWRAAAARPRCRQPGSPSMRPRLVRRTRPSWIRIRLDHVFQRVARLGQRRRQRLHADRPAGVVFGDAAQIAAVHRIQAEPVHLQPGQRGVGDRAIDRACALARRRSRARGAAGGRRCAACRGTGGRSPPRRPRSGRSPACWAPRLTISSSSSGV